MSFFKRSPELADTLMADAAFPARFLIVATADGRLAKFRKDTQAVKAGGTTFLWETVTFVGFDDGE